MKALTTPSGNFGPFHSIEVLADRYRCDNTDLPFTVVGQGTIVEADTITWPEPPAPPRDIKAEITALEAKVTNRRIREAILGDNGWLENTNAEIAALRAQL